MLVARGVLGYPPPPIRILNGLGARQLALVLFTPRHGNARVDKNQITHFPPPVLILVLAVGGGSGFETEEGKRGREEEKGERGKREGEGEREERKVVERGEGK